MFWLLHCGSEMVHDYTAQIAVGHNINMYELIKMSGIAFCGDILRRDTTRQTLFSSTFKRNSVQ